MNHFKEKYIEIQFINRKNNIDMYKAINSITNDEVILNIFIDEINNCYLEQLKTTLYKLKDMENPNLINISTMGSFVENSKTYYYVEQELFNGKSLSEKLESGKLTSIEAAKILKQISEGLKEFHFKSLIFGNLNCDNIYIDDSGLVKINTLAYIENKDLDENISEDFSEEEDIFSLGRILFELVTGNADFKLGKCDKEISDTDLLLIIDRCTNKKYKKYVDLNEFISNINSYIEYGGVSSESFNEVIEDEENLEIECKSRKRPYLKIIRNICACVLLIAISVTVINGKNLFNKDDIGEEVIIETPDFKKEEELVEEVEEVEGQEEIVDDEIADESYNTDAIYNDNDIEDDYSDNNQYISTNSNNNYGNISSNNGSYNNSYNSNTNTNNNNSISNNNNHNNSNNNSSNNGNSNNNNNNIQNPSYDDTEKPPSDDSEDNENNESAPDISPNPGDTSDNESSEDSDINIETE